jgi:hypothetical protein
MDGGPSGKWMYKTVVVENAILVGEALFPMRDEMKRNSMLSIKGTRDQRTLDPAPGSRVRILPSPARPPTPVQNAHQTSPQGRVTDHNKIVSCACSPLVLKFAEPVRRTLLVYRIGFQVHERAAVFDPG